MCGVVGYIGSNHEPYKMAFMDLLHLDVMRGKDATGVAFVGENHDVHVVKDDVLPHELMNSEEFCERIDQPNIALLGHNRAATRGVINQDNAHPFEAGNIIGMHNGTLYDFAIKRLPAKEKYATDSETIINAINEVGIRNTWRDLDGPAVLIWWDTADDTLNFISNRKRPFCFAMTKKRDALFFASESWLINIVKKFHHIEFTSTWFPKSDFLFTIKYKDNKVTYTTKQLAPFQYEEYRERNPTMYANIWGQKDSASTPAKRADIKPNITVYDHNKSNSAHIAKNVIQANRLQRRLEKKRKKQVSQIMHGIRGTVKNATVTAGNFGVMYTSCLNCGDGLSFNDSAIMFLDENRAFCGNCSAFLEETG